MSLHEAGVARLRRLCELHDCCVLAAAGPDANDDPVSADVLRCVLGLEAVTDLVVGHVPVQQFQGADVATLDVLDLQHGGHATPSKPAQNPVGTDAFRWHSFTLTAKGESSVRVRRDCP